MKKTTYKTTKGIALVEVIAALGIAMIVLTAVVALTLFTVRSSLNSRLLLQGTKTATKEAELIRAYRDSSPWDTYLSSMIGCSTVCHMNATSGLPESNSITEGSGVELVTRSFSASNPSGGALVAGDQIVKITVTTSWVVGGVTKSTHLYTNFTNWR